MRKITTSMALVAITFAASAQIKIAPTFGVTSNTLKANYSDTSVTEPKFDSRTGFFIGGTVQMGLKGILTVDASLLFKQKGANTNIEETYNPNNKENVEVKGEEYIVLNYIELPVNLGVNIELSDVLGLKVNAGPYIAKGIGGNYKQDITINTTTDNGGGSSSMSKQEYDADYEVVFENPVEKREVDKRYFKAWDAGLSIGAELKLSDFILGLGYSYGLRNLTPQYDENPEFEPNDYKLHNRALLLKVGLEF